MKSHPDEASARENLVFPEDLRFEDFGERGMVLFRLSDRTPRVLNASGASVFKALLAGRSLHEAARDLAAEFELDHEDALIDAELLMAGLVVEGIAGSEFPPDPVSPMPGDWKYVEEKVMSMEQPATNDQAAQADSQAAAPLDATPAICQDNLVLREEDEGAFLFQPESGELSALNPVGVDVWKLIDGKRTVSGIADVILSEYEEVSPDAVRNDVRTFIAELKKMGYVRLGG